MAKPILEPESFDSIAHILNHYMPHKKGCKISRAELAFVITHSVNHAWFPSPSLLIQGILKKMLTLTRLQPIIHIPASVTGSGLVLWLNQLLSLDQISPRLGKEAFKGESINRESRTKKDPKHRTPGTLPEAHSVGLTPHNIMRPSRVGKAYCQRPDLSPECSDSWSAKYLYSF